MHGSNTEKLKMLIDCMWPSDVLSLFCGNDNPLAQAVKGFVEEKPSIGEISTLFFNAECNPILQAVLQFFAPAVKKSTGIGENVTARWIAKNWARVRSELLEVISRKFRVSRTISVAEDHLQTFMLKLIEHDSFAPYISNGGEVRMSNLRMWVCQSSCTEIRGWGVDASLRESRGSQTARERSGVKTWKDNATPASEIRSDSGERLDLFNPYDSMADEQVIRRERVEQCRDMIREEMPGAADRYLAIFDHILAGTPRKDIANIMGVSPNRMAIMMVRLKEAIDID